jgi:gamma-glutamyltranspeptidase/glutathione hydrolase
MQFEEVNGRILSVAKGRGVVSSVSQDASVFAVDVLKDGGNAFDAAFALAFALAVCHPQAGNLGGGGYLLFKPARSSTPLMYNYRERSSLQANRESYLNDHGEPDPEKTSFGPQSVCVPGTVKAFFTLHKEFGSLDSKHMLNKLSDLARSGCRITEYQAQCLNRLRPKLIQSPGTRKILTKEEGKYTGGDLLYNPDLGDTFEILAAEGWRSFYGGEIAEKIEESVSGNGGFVRVEDLKQYEISMPDPITTELQGHTIFTVPPEGGGSILIEIINILNNEGFARLEPYTPQYYHYLAQAAKIAFIDRMDYMGEYAYRENEVYTSLTDTKTNLHRFNLIESNRDIPTPEYLKKLYKTATAKMLGGFEGGTDTTHFSIADTQGNAVSNSYTLNLRYGSKWTVDGTGILMNGTTDSFSFVPGKSNYFGVVGNHANTFEPDKRPASNMAPVLVMRGKDVHFLMGSPGGPTIPTSIAGVLFAVLLHGLDPRRCIAEGRIHHQAWPDTLFREDDPVLIEKINTLAEKGYHIEQRHEPIGDMHAVYQNGDAYTAVSDYRRQGAAASL